MSDLGHGPLSTRFPSGTEFTAEVVRQIIREELHIALKDLDLAASLNWHRLRPATEK